MGIARTTHRAHEHWSDQCLGIYVYIICELTMSSDVIIVFVYEYSFVILLTVSAFVYSCKLVQRYCHCIGLLV